MGLMGDDGTVVCGLVEENLLISVVEYLHVYKLAARYNNKHRNTTL